MQVDLIMENELRPFWRRFIAYDWKLGLSLLLAVCIPRFILVLHANATGNYGFIGLIMLMSAMVPFVFLNKSGRKKIGIRRPSNFHWLAYAFLAGLILSLLLFYFGQSIYGDSYHNWYVYIGKSYKIPSGISPDDKAILFIIMAVTGMTFSPVGEELFFRGIVHESFAKSIGEKKATIVDASAFAFTHISHFGLVFIHGRWEFLTTPTLLWVLGMFLASILFVAFKKRSGSLLGAILCHATFNLGMIYCIFYLL